MNASRLFHLVLLVVTAVACLGCGSKERTPFELAEHYFLQPDYPRALEACQAALAQASTNTEKADILVIRGRCYIGQGHEAIGQDKSQLAAELYAKAISEFTAALQLDSKHLDALHNRRMAYRLTNQPELEAADYALIRENDPNYQTAYQIDPEKDVIIQRITELAKTEETNPEERLANDDQTLIELDNDDDEDEKKLEPGNKGDQAVAHTGTPKDGVRKPGPRISVADYEPSMPDPTSQFSQWLSQHELDPSLGHQPAPIPPTTLDRTLLDLNPDEDGEGDESQSNDETSPDDTEQRIPGLTSPSTWPSSSQWPQYPTPNSTSLPTTGIVGPSLYPPATDTQPPLPYGGMVAPTGSTGVGAAPLPDRSAPYSASPSVPNASQTLPTTGITGTFSPYGRRG